MGAMPFIRESNFSSVGAAGASATMRWTIPPWSLLWLIGLGECGPTARARGPRSPNPPKPRRGRAKGGERGAARAAAQSPPRSRGTRTPTRPRCSSSARRPRRRGLPEAAERQFACKLDARDGRAAVRAAAPRRLRARRLLGPRVHPRVPLPARCWSGTVEPEPTPCRRARARGRPRALEPAASAAPAAPRRRARAARARRARLGPVERRAQRRAPRRVARVPPRPRRARAPLRRVVGRAAGTRGARALRGGGPGRFHACRGYGQALGHPGAVRRAAADRRGEERRRGALPAARRVRGPAGSHYSRRRTRSTTAWRASSRARTTGPHARPSGCCTATTSCSSA